MQPASRRLSDRPSSGGASLPDWAREAADDVDLRVLCDVVVRRDIEVAFPSYAEDQEFVDHLTASVRENLRTLQDVLCARMRLSDVRLRQPLTFGAVQARLRIPQSALQRSYRVGFVAMWETWAARLRAHAQSADISRDETSDALTALTLAIFGYQDHVAVQVADTYIREDEALSRSRAHVRQRLIRGLLDGDEDRLSPSDLLTIGYEFDAHHVAVLLPEVAEGAAGRLTIGMRTATGARQSLIYPSGLRSTVVWLSRLSPWPGELVDRLRAALSTAGVTASLGEGRPGLEGFRRTYAQTQDVERIRAAWGPERSPRVINYSEVGLEVLLMRDHDLARRFVEDELGPLALDNPETARLRETLDTWFRLGSHVATAEFLGLHEHTIRNRLRKVEKLIGHGVGERRTETQVALRVMTLLANRP
ncbi:CdaR family transcriptional regulator [Microbispora sp. H10836]|uniref:PucR family transcriptional regulator n=1 Tax=Microbispora sp. H10836 TaxID=2729106 RepID=UPI001475EB7D|nr:helix-turn-helix domain-containing protein [Microbispora sp. H10836]